MGGRRVKGADSVARVRRQYYRRGKAIREIPRELNMSRNTVRGMIRSGSATCKYERSIQPQLETGPWQSDLDQLLADNAARPSRERLTLTQSSKNCAGSLDYERSYDAVRRYAAYWRQARC